VNLVKGFNLEDSFKVHAGVLLEGLMRNAYWNDKVVGMMIVVMIWMSKKFKVEKEKVVADAEAGLLKIQPSYLNVQHLTELMVNSLKTKLIKLLIDHDFSASIPTKLKELSFKVNEINREIGDLKQYMEKLEIEVPGDLKALLDKKE
nr:hypothetical protein [Tanacetum cinerariifolium]